MPSTNATTLCPPSTDSTDTTTTPTCSWAGVTLLLPFQVHLDCVTKDKKGRAHIQQPSDEMMWGAIPAAKQELYKRVVASRAAAKQAKQAGAPAQENAQADAADAGSFLPLDNSAGGSDAIQLIQEEADPEEAALVVVVDDGESAPAPTDGEAGGTGSQAIDTTQVGTSSSA